MQYPYLTFLEAISIVLTLFIGIVIFYFLIRLFNKTIKFLTVLKGILLYEICAVIIYSIYPAPLFQSLKFSVINLAILGVVLFLIFYFITRKYFLINWRKSLAVFFLMTFIIFPLLDYFRTNLEFKLMNLSVFAEERAKMEAEMEAYFKEYGFGGFLYAPLIPSPPEQLSFKILGKIESAIFSWPTNILRQIIIQKDNEPVEKTPEYYVKVISPNGGEQIEVGQSLDIRWDSKNIGSVNVSLLSSDNLAFDTVDVVRICSKIDASLGHCEAELTNFHTAHYYKIRIEGFREKSTEKLTYTVTDDDSDNPFSITGNFIFVLSPNGGEKIHGDSVIVWGSNNVENIIITLMENNSKSYLINKSFDASRGYFDWKIDKSADYIGRSDLKIVLYDAAYCDYVDQSTGVECVKDGVSHSDSSDNYFSILEQ